MQVNKRNIRHLPGWILSLALLFALTGCFDYTINLKLRPEGDGLLKISLDIPHRLGKSDTGPDAPKLQTIVFPAPERAFSAKGDRISLAEQVKFDWLDKVALRRVMFTVDRLSGGLLGMTTSTFRVTVKLSAWEGDLPDRSIRPGTELDRQETKGQDQDPDAAKARRLLSASMSGHRITVGLDLPGRVTEAWPLVVGSKEIKPRFREGRIVWRVPISELIRAQVRHNLTFRCEFKGSLQFRGPHQTEASSRYPTKKDEKAAEKQLKQRAGKDADAARQAEE